MKLKELAWFKSVFFFIECKIHYWLNRSPPIYKSKQKQPYDINKMPIPSGKLKTKMLFRFKVSFQTSEKQTIKKMVPIITWAP